MGCRGNSDETPGRVRTHERRQDPYVVGVQRQPPTLPVAAVRPLPSPLVGRHTWSPVPVASGGEREDRLGVPAPGRSPDAGLRDRSRAALLASYRAPLFLQ